MKKYIVIITLLLTVIVSAEAQIKNFSKAPDIVAFTLDGDSFHSRGWSDKVTVLNFFWIYCVPCAEELPKLAQLEKQYPLATFVTVHVENEPEADIQNFLDKLPNHPKTIVISSPMTKKSYQVKGLPYTILLSRGKVSRVFTGYTEENFEKLTTMIQIMAR